MIVTVYYSIILSSRIIISNVGKPNSHASKRCQNTIDLTFILIIFCSSPEFPTEVVMVLYNVIEQCFSIYYHSA